MPKFVKGLAIFLYLFCLQAYASESLLVVSRKVPALLSQPGSLSAILKRGYFQVAMLASLPPFVDIPRSGDPTGLDIDLIKQMAAALGVRAKVQVVQKPSQLLQWVEQGRVDIASSNIQMTLGSTQRVYFSVPYRVASYAMLVNRYYAEQLNLNRNLTDYNVKNCRLGYVVEGANLAVLKFPFAKATKFRFKHFSVAIAALKAGKIDALLSDSVTLQKLYRNNPMNAFTIRFIELPELYMFSGIAQRFSGVMLGSWIKHFIERRRALP